MENDKTNKVVAKEFYSKAEERLHKYDFEGNNYKHLEEALLLFQSALEKDPSMIDAYVAIANCKIRRRFTGDLDESAKIFEEVIKLQPENSSAHLGLGRCLHMKGDVESAISEMEAAILYNPDFYTAHFDVARLYVLKRNRKKAKEHLQLATNSEFDQISSSAKELLEVIDRELENTKK